MTEKIISLRKLILAFMVCACCATFTSAQATRTWVSGVGDDANPCSRTAPCKTFAGAISKTAAGGEISVLDPAGFGAVTITKAITISGDGSLAGILNAGTNGIIVNAGANDVIIIRNLSLLGFGTGLNGIRFLAGNQLIVENTTISGNTGHGIDVALGAAGKLTVLDTSIRDCGGAGINVASGGTPAVSADKVRIQNCATGLDLANGNATISQSTLSHITNQALRSTASGAVINAENCTLTNNGTGVNVTTGGAIIRLSNCVVMNNTTGIAITGGTVASFGNNKITGNTTNGTPNSFAIQQ